MVEDGAAAAQKAATFNAGTTSNKNIYVNNCNARGTINANGNPAYTIFDDFAWTNSNVEFDHFYSDLKDTYYTVPIINVYSQDTNPTSYPNLTDSEIEKGIGILSILESTNGGVCVPAGCENSVEWFTNVVNSGYAIISHADISNSKEYNLYDVSVAIDTNLQEVQDEQYLRKAEAKYEADMRRIDMKDRKYDTDLAALDAERNAIKSEMETLKTVAKDNVERTFKLFS